MRPWLVLLSLVPLLWCASCVTRPVAADQAGPDSLRSLSLQDVQGLFGGQNLWLRADGLLLVQQVQPGLTEKRWRLQLEPATVQAVERLVLVEHPLAGIEIPERMGVPDEARPQIVLHTTGGARFEVAKWANDTHERFDAIYAALLRLVQRAGQEGTLTHEGAFDWGWRPEGF